jgi:hypothetical protein
VNHFRFQARAGNARSGERYEMTFILPVAAKEK